MTTSRKTVLHSAILVALAFVFVSCQGDRTSGGDGINFGSGSGDSASGASDNGIDLGDGYIDDVSDPTRRGSAGSANRGRAWSIVLKTFTQEDHARAAMTMLAELNKIDPMFGNARIETTPKGSMVVYGAYAEATDANAQEDLARVRAASLNGRAIFPRAYLSRVQRASRAGPAHPNSLMAVRQKYPNVSPLYTLDIAVWFDFESGTMTVDQIQQAAETYVDQLRRQGVEAFFHHDPDRGMSTATVGLFGRDAYDHESGIFSLEVEALLRRFPERLNNGEPLLIPVNPRRPEGRKIPQTPKLVEVPGG